jgi:hypothetical protein
MNVSRNSLSTTHPFRPMQDDFFGWLGRAESQGHLTNGNVGHAKKAFFSRFQHADLSTGSTACNSLQQWIKTVTTQKHITNGNAHHMSTAISGAYNRVMTKAQPSIPTVVTPPSKSANKPKTLKEILLQAKVKKTDNVYKLFFEKITSTIKNIMTVKLKISSVCCG